MCNKPYSLAADHRSNLLWLWCTTTNDDAYCWRLFSDKIPERSSGSTACWWECTHLARHAKQTIKKERGVGRGPKNLGDVGALPPWDVDVAVPREIFLSSPVLPCQIRSDRSNRTSVIMELCQKILILTSSYSRSLKVIATDTDWSATYDFLLAFHRSIVTMGLSRIPFSR